MPVLTKAGPWLIKQLPRLWPLLLDPKNRERVAEMTKNLASQSPGRRLRGKVDLTAAVTDRLAQESTSEAERARALEWSRRARNLVLRLDMPTTDRRMRRSQLRSVEAQLAALQAEIDGHLNQLEPLEPAPTSDQ